MPAPASEAGALLGDDDRDAATGEGDRGGQAADAGARDEDG
jgi:hypothetical protein